MKGGVEHGDLRRVRHHLAHHVDAGVCGRVVKRRQLLAGLEFGPRVIVDERGLAEVLAIRDDAISDGIDLVEAADGAAGSLHQYVQQLLEAFRHRKARHVIGGLGKVGCERDIHERFG